MTDATLLSSVHLRTAITGLMSRVFGSLVSCGDEERSELMHEVKRLKCPDTKVEYIQHVPPAFSEFFSLPQVIERSKRPILDLVCFIYRTWGGNKASGMGPEHDINGVASAAMILYNQLTSYQSLGQWVEGAASIDIRFAWACCVSVAFKFELDDEIQSMALILAQHVLSPEEKKGMSLENMSDSVSKYEVFICDNCRVMNSVYDSPACVARMYLFKLQEEGKINYPTAELSARSVFFFYYNLHTELSQFLFSTNETEAGRALAMVALSCLQSLGAGVWMTKDFATPHDFCSAAKMAHAVYLKGEKSQHSVGGDYTNERSLDHAMTKQANIKKSVELLRSMN